MNARQHPRYAPLDAKAAAHSKFVTKQRRRRGALGRLKPRAMEYISRIKSAVHQAASTVTQALPGNPIFREYECREQIASAGPGNAWKIYSGVKHSTKQLVAIWLFDKKFCDKWPKDTREAFCELLKRGISQLTRLRHPRLLTVEHALEESRDTLAFCTEPVVTSLANVFGEDNRPSAGLKLAEVEIKHGLFQLGEALVFLHNDARILHCNVAPSSVIVNERGAWKLAGFDFCVPGTSGENGKVTFTVQPRDLHSYAALSPVLDYSAPEVVFDPSCDTNADVFSLGMLAYALFNDYQPLFDNRDLLDAYRANADKLKDIPNSRLSKLPAELQDDVKACLHRNPELRPDAIQFTKIVYFDDVLVKTLNYLESLMQMDNTQKMQFFKSLPQILSKFPPRCLLQKVLPCLTGEFGTPPLVPFILPNIFIISEGASAEEFSHIVFPSLIPVFSMTNPYQIVLILLQKMSLFLQKTPEGDIKRYVLPLIYGAISNDNIKVQELCLSIIPSIGKLVERDQMKTQLLPKLLRLSLDGSVLAIRIQTLVCIGKLLPTLESWMVADQILPALPKIISKEPGVLMAILGIYKLAYENERFGIAREQCAKSVLPFLIATSVENTLNLQQFEQYVTMIRTLLEKVEREQRTRLQQLSAGQEEQRGFQDFNELVAANNSVGVNSTPDLDALSALFGPGPKAGSSMSPTGPSGTGQLSLEEKKRRAAAQGQGTSPMPVTPASATSPKPSLNSLLNSTPYTPTKPNSTSNQASTGYKPFNGQSMSSSSFNDFMTPPKPSAPKPMAPMASSGFGLPPPPSASNPVHRSSGPVSGGFASFGMLPPPSAGSAQAKDDILDLFKQSPAPQKSSANVDELIALTNQMPLPRRTQPAARDPFADILK